MCFADNLGPTSYREESKNDWPRFGVWEDKDGSVSQCNLSVRMVGPELTARYYKTVGRG